MKTVTKILAPLALFASMSAQADFIGGSVEASYWYGGVGGDATFGSTVDAEDDLGFGDDSFFEIAATVEHPVPLIPNVRVKYADIEQSSDGNLTASFGNTATEVTGSVETTLDLSHMDLILYYEILDNWVSVDIGLDFKKFDGVLELTETTGLTPNTSTTDIDEFLPLAYASAEIALPFTDMSFGAELSALTYSDTAIYDGKVRFRQGFSLAFIELGYRQMGFKLEDIDDLDVDVNIGGAYISTGLDF